MLREGSGRAGTAETIMTLDATTELDRVLAILRSADQVDTVDSATGHKAFPLHPICPRVRQCGAKAACPSTKIIATHRRVTHFMYFSGVSCTPLEPLLTQGIEM